MDHKTHICTLINYDDRQETAFVNGLGGVLNITCVIEQQFRYVSMLMNHMVCCLEVNMKDVNKMLRFRQVCPDGLIFKKFDFLPTKVQKEFLNF